METDPASGRGADVVKKSAPRASPAWTRIDTLVNIKLDKGLAPTIEQARELVGDERPALYARAIAE